MKKVFICSPLRGDYIGNIQKAKEYCRYAAFCENLPIAPHLYFTRFLNDQDEKQREMGIRMGLQLLEMCEEIWVFGDPTEGMKLEILHAAAHDIPVKYAQDVLIKAADQLRDRPNSIVIDTRGGVVLDE